MLSCKFRVLPLVACALVLGSCLQAGLGEIELESLPRVDFVVSDPFAIDGGDVLVVTLQGAVLRPDPNPDHFVLTRGGQRVPLDMLLHVAGDRITFGFYTPPAAGGGYRLTIMPAAIQSGMIRAVNIRVIESGLRTVAEDTRFGRTAIWSVGYGLGRFVAVGDGGAMAFSFDGSGWTGVRPGEGLGGNSFVGAIRGVAANDGEFFAVGDGARMAFSGNGIAWTGHSLHDSSGYGETHFHGYDIRAVTFGRGATGGGRFVVAGGGGRAMFRWDDDQWRVGTGIDSGVTINTVVWGSTGIYGRLVAAGSGGAVYYADEGIARMTWRRAAGNPLGGYAVNASAFGNGVFVIAGDGGRMALSEDGITWTAIANRENGSSIFGESGVLDLAFGSGVFIAVGHDGIMAKSADGIDWELVPNSEFRPWDRITGVATDGAGRFVAVGNSYVDNSSRIVSWFQKSSENAWPREPDFFQVRNWGAVPLSGIAGGGAIRGVAWNGTQYVAVGDNLVAVSTNGINWTEIVGEWVFPDSPGRYSRVHFRDVAWGEGRFVAVGYRPGTRQNTAVVAFSDDGESWTFVHPETLVLRQPIGVGAILVVDPRIYAIAFAAGQFVAVGERAWSAWSQDGEHWVPVWISPFSMFDQNDINQNAMAVVGDGAVFVVGGTLGRIASSADGGRSWDWIANGLLDGEFNDIMALTYGDGMFVAAGADGRMRVANSGQIYSAASWVRVSSGIGFHINDVAWGAGSFVAVGNYGSLAFSGDGVGWTAVEPGPGWEDGGNIYSVVAGSRFVAGGREKIIFSE